MKTPMVLFNSPRRPSGVRQRPVYLVDNSLISHQDNQNRYLRAYEPLANITDPGYQKDLNEVEDNLRSEMIGPGRMGMNMAQRLLRGCHETAAFNATPDPR